jgi:hypothetical protein
MNIRRHLRFFVNCKTHWFTLHRKKHFSQIPLYDQLDSLLIRSLLLRLVDDLPFFKTKEKNNCVGDRYVNEKKVLLS